MSWYQSICFLNQFKFLIVSICCQSHPQTIWKIYKKWKISELYFSKTSPISIICLFSIIFNLCNRKHQCWFPTVSNLSNPKEPENNEVLYPISFLCPNGTIFNQEVFVCEWWWVVAASNYMSNQHCCWKCSYYYESEIIGIMKVKVKKRRYEQLSTNRKKGLEKFKHAEMSKCALLAGQSPN